MSFAFSEINWVAIIVATVANMVVGGFWYSPLAAGKAWMKEVGLTEDDMKDVDAKTPMIKATVGAFVLAIGLAVILNHTGADSISGAFTGFFLSVMITAASTFCNYAFEDKTNRHFLIHTGNHILAMTVMGAIIGGWS